MKARPPASSNQAFTLVELLTVIAIISILAGILIPVVSGVRKKAAMTECVGRLRHLSTALGTYASDNKGTFLQPENIWTKRWPIVLLPYVNANLADGYGSGKVSYDKIMTSGYFKCPTMDYIDTPPLNAGVYAYNLNLEKTAARPAPVNVNMLSNPSTFPVLVTTDETGGPRLFATGATPGPSAKAVDYGYSGTTNPYGPAPNFNGKAGFLFGDWHVAMVDVCNRNAWPWNTPDAFAVK